MIFVFVVVVISIVCSGSNDSLLLIFFDKFGKFFDFVSSGYFREFIGKV